MAIIFDGRTFAKNKEKELQKKLTHLSLRGKYPRVVTFTFVEDEGSGIYTRLKKAAADRIGLAYLPIELSFDDDPGYIVQKIRETSFDSQVTGVMVQKPAKSVWITKTNGDGDKFERWWEELTAAIDPAKDVDCLTHTSLSKIYSSRVYRSDFLLPATAQAILDILTVASRDLQIPDEEWRAKDILVIGKSEIVGKPLTHVLRLLGHRVENVGHAELATLTPSSFPILISATGTAHFIDATMVAPGGIVVDVGSPQGDVDQESVAPKVAFLTPVPEGVGPVTIVSLLSNCLKLCVI